MVNTANSNNIPWTSNIKKDLFENHDAFITNILGFINGQNSGSHPVIKETLMTRKKSVNVLTRQYIKQCISLLSQVYNELGIKSQSRNFFLQELEILELGDTLPPSILKIKTDLIGILSLPIESSWRDILDKIESIDYSQQWVGEKQHLKLI